LNNLLISDAKNQRIRKVDTKGIISTVAENGTQKYAGDGDSPTLASLDYPYAVAVDTFGNLFIADAGNNCIRKVNKNGIISTVAGNGKRGYRGDGGQAIEAMLANPYGVAVDRLGNIYIGDGVNNCIRMVDTFGIITTIAGNGNVT